MSRSLTAWLLAFTSASISLLHCSSDNASAPAGADDGGRDSESADAKSEKDAVAPDAENLAVVAESEPNNGALLDGGADAAPLYQVNAFSVPGAMKGAIDPADDADLFGVALKPGEFWQWTLVPTGDYAPSLTVFDTIKGNFNPTVIVRGDGPGTTVTLDQFVLHSGSFVAGVRDARNLSPSSHVGGPGTSYRLEARKFAPAATTVTFPKTVTGQLSRVTEIAFFKFAGTKGTGFDLIVRAARKGAGSKLNSRLSLFNLTSNQALLTNDDANGSTTDSEIGGTLPANADYLVILENEDQGEQPFGATVPDLSYDLEFKLR